MTNNAVVLSMITASGIQLQNNLQSFWTTSDLTTYTRHRGKKKKKCESSHL